MSDLSGIELLRLLREPLSDTQISMLVAAKRLLRSVLVEDIVILSQQPLSEEVLREERRLINKIMVLDREIQALLENAVDADSILSTLSRGNQSINLSGLSAITPVASPSRPPTRPRSRKIKKRRR